MALTIQVDALQRDRGAPSRLILAEFFTDSKTCPLLRTIIGGCGRRLRLRYLARRATRRPSGTVRGAVGCGGRACARKPCCPLFPRKWLTRALPRSVDSREFRRLIAPGVRIIWKSLPVYGGSRSRCRPAGAMSANLCDPYNARLLNLSQRKLRSWSWKTPSNYKITSASAGTGSYQVEIAGNGEEALQRIQNGCSPRVVLLDMQMPGMDGLETLRICDNFTRGRRSSCAPAWTIPIRSGRRSHSGLRLIWSSQFSTCIFRQP